MPVHFVNRRLLLVRALVVLGLAAVALHELRYLDWLGEAHGHAGGHRPVGLLTLLTPAVTILLTALCAAVLVVAARRGARGSDEHVRLRNLWLIATGGLLATFACQELLQGMVHPGHPFGLHGVFGHGGWIVVPLAFLLGGIVAMAVGFVRELERRFAWGGGFSYLWPASGDLIRPSSPALLAGPALATNLAGRSPPRVV